MSRMAVRGGAFFNTFARRPRLLIGLGLGVAAYVLAPWSLREATRALIGWNVGAWAFIALVAHLMLTSTDDDIRDHAAQEDETPVGAAADRRVRGDGGDGGDRLGARPRQGHEGREQGAASRAGRRDDLQRLGVHASDVRAALRRAILCRATAAATTGCAAASCFRNATAPGWGEFCYEAFVIGCACATADVNLTSRGARVICLSGRRRVLLQHDHSRADDQHRRRADLNKVWS